MDTKKVHIATDKSSCWTVDNYLTYDEATDLFSYCKNELDYVHDPKGRFMNKEITMHRSVAFYSDVSKGYMYTGQTMIAQPMPKKLQVLLDKVQHDLETPFNAWLVNYYKNGNDSIGAHSDNESSLSPNGSVAAITLGYANRPLRIRNKNGSGFTDLITHHGQLLVMDGHFQKEFTHEIPVSKKVSEPRISLTARYHQK